MADATAKAVRLTQSKVGGWQTVHDRKFVAVLKENLRYVDHVA